jgi:hypothetical protein
MASTEKLSRRRPRWLCCCEIKTIFLPNRDLTRHSWIDPDRRVYFVAEVDTSGLDLPHGDNPILVTKMIPEGHPDFVRMRAYHWAAKRAFGVSIQFKHDPSYSV